jgi:acyl transferase domain-containing protein
VTSRLPGGVAIIGMACLYPRANGLREFWENILAGVDGIGDPPPESWTHQVFDPTSGDNDRLYTKRGGYLTTPPRFNPVEFGVMPRSVDGAEPEQFVALQLARDALADAGYLDRPFDRRKAGVILGRGTYVNRGVISCFQHTLVVDQVISLLRRLEPERPEGFFKELREHLKAGLPPFNPENAPGLAHSVLVGRIANRLDLMGPAFTVDAACASSLIAVDYGTRDLMSGTCDLVLAGGIQISTTHPIALLFTQLGALARSGQVRPFHAEADGTLLGEGAGILVLKRLADAERDGDRIYAVIRGVGTSSDGKAMGILAPRVEGEELAMRRAYEAAGVDPASIGLIEAHGTGTPVGDEVEIEALRRVFGDGDGTPRIPIGSVKSMIGHPIPAAAVAGLIKAALSVYHGILPPTLHADAPHPKLFGSAFYLNRETRPWIHGGPDPRRAGVSAFGFGGINAHVVIEEHGARRAAARPAPASVPAAATAAAGTFHPPALVHARRDTELCILRAPARAALVERATALTRFLRANPDVRLCDVAYTLSADRDPGRDGTRLAIVAASPAELLAKTEWALERLKDPACRRIKEIGGIYLFEQQLAREGTLAFLFPGEGAQYPGMMGDLCLHFPEARAWFDLMDRAFRDHRRGFVPSRFVFPATPTSHADAASRIWDMTTAIESVFAANQAMHAILTRLGLRPQAIVGHSTGEYSALLAAGAVTVDDDDRLIAYVLDGNRATEAATRAGKVPEGILLAVGPADPKVLKALTEDPVHPLIMAMDNCPHQAVVCGTEEAITRAQETLRRQGAVCQRLPFTRAYHTSLFEAVTDELRTYYETGQFRAPEIPLWSCATAAPFPADPEGVRGLALAQWSRPVRFRETIEAMYAEGARLFAECGPRGNLSAFVGDTLRGRPHLAVPANMQRRPGLTQLHHLLGLLEAHGLDLQLDTLYTDRDAVRLPADALWSGQVIPAKHERSLRLDLHLPALRIDDAFLARNPARAAVPAALPTTHPVTATPAAATTVAASPPAEADPRTAAMQAYMKTMEQFLATQQAVVRSLVARRAAQAPATQAPPEVHPAAAGRPAAGGPGLTGLPFVDGPMTTAADGALVFRRVLSLDRDLFLLDHTIGGRVSEDPALRALPVLPLAMSLEIMAEAAACALPGRRPVGLQAVRVQRWISIDGPEVALMIRVVPAPGGAEAAVRIALVGANGDPVTAVEGTVLLSDRYAEPPAPTRFAPTAAQPCRWSPAELYAPGELHGMFHGPAFRGVAAIDAIGEDGAVGSLRALTGAGLFRSRPGAALLLDPVILDAASQVLGYWTAQRLKKGFVVFPFAIEKVQIFGPPLPPGATATCRTRAGLLEGNRVRADFEIESAGRLHMRVIGWEVKKQHSLPERLYAFRQSPKDVILSQTVPGPDPIRDRVLCARLELPLGFFEADGGIWWECLAHFVLGRAERETWRSFGSSRRRAEWLMGRTVAKDAVRHYVLERRQVALFPADIAITTDGHGRPVPGGEALGRLGLSLSLSLAHTDGVAVAVVGEPARGVGIDVERLSRRRGAYEDAAFTAGERALLGAAGGTREERALRLWCAKEAVGKALGRGLMGNPLNLEARSVDTNLGTVSLGVTGRLAQEFPGLVGSSVTAFTGREGDLIVATALYEGGH